ncbi:hypothetical protein D046_2959B, partial [Vibrio parahaemolyticus V-223/04]
IAVKKTRMVIAPTKKKPTKTQA